MTYAVAERLLEQARADLAAPTAFEYRDLCVWCGRDRPARTGETPRRQPGDLTPAHGDEPPRLCHAKCFAADQPGRGIIAALYRHCPDHLLPWLDGLLITAGFLRRCSRCAAMTPAEQRCTECGASDHAEADPVDGVRDWFAAYQAAPEAVWTIPSGSSDTSLRVGIAALGGGTLGRSYADNNWIYGIFSVGRLIICGMDLRSGGFGRTHYQMAILLAEYLADDNTVDEAIRQRLATWVENQRTESGHEPPG
jgi:hypothetical protein